MKLFRKVTIIGVGLVGGSIGIAIQRKGIAGEVMGVFRRASTLRKALEHKAVTSATMSIKEGVRGADLIILATPVYTIPVVAREVITFADKSVILTDVGSTKAWLVNTLERMVGRSSKDISFVGSHPMAGSDHAGVEFAKADLLDSAPCIVTKTPRTSSKGLSAVVRFWRALGSRVTVMDPDKHDEAVSLVSHLPHIVAFGLADAVPAHELQYAAEGFKDTTRVASSDPELWADIFLTNRNRIVKAGRLFEKHYKGILAAISRGDYPGLVKILERAKVKRDAFVHTRRA